MTENQPNGVNDETRPIESTSGVPAAPESSAPGASAAPMPEQHRSGSHTRTILEVIGGVVAAGLIVVAGVVGFAVGHWTGDGRDGRDGRGDRGEGYAMQGDGYGMQGERAPGMPGQQGPGQQGPGQRSFGDQRGERGPGGHHGGPGGGMGQGDGYGPGGGMGQAPAPSQAPESSPAPTS